MELEGITLEDITEDNIDELLEILNKMTFSERCKQILCMIEVSTSLKNNMSLKKLKKIYIREFDNIQHFNKITRSFNWVDGSRLLNVDDFIVFGCKISNEKNLNIIDEECENNKDILYPLFLEQNKQISKK